MGIVEATILHHVCLVFLSLWLLSLYNLSHPFAYLASLIYLYLVHERYAMRLRRKLRFEERKSCNQRRVLMDSESVRWLNYVVEKIWLICMEGIVSQKILLPIIPWFLDKYKPWTVKKAVVKHLYMGRSPPTFTEMRILRQCPDDDHLVLEIGMNFRTANDMSAILAVKLKKRLGFGMKTRLHLMGMHIEGKLINSAFLSKAGSHLVDQLTSCVYKLWFSAFLCVAIPVCLKAVLVGLKFLSHWPFLGRLRVCFAEPPYFQMTVKPMFTRGLDVTEVPGIAGWLDKLLALAFEQTLVEPNMLVVDVEKFVSPQPEPWFSVDEKEPIAHALVEVIEATDMKPSDLNGFADPYVKGKLGQYRFRTKIQKKTLAPRWHEEFKVPICTWESPNSLAIEVRDKDRFVDDTLGDCLVDIANFRSGQRHDMWLSLRNIKMGRLHLAITVVEDNTKDQNQPGNVEPISDDNNENDNISRKSVQKVWNSPKKSEISPKLADRLEAINVEGQEKTGLWVHQPGNEVSQIWEQKKGRNRLIDSEIKSEGSYSFDRSSFSESLNNENSSSEENEGKKRKKIMRGLKKIGLAMRFKKEDNKKEFLFSPHPNIKAANDQKIRLKLVLENDFSTPCPVDGTMEESVKKRHVKDRAKGILKHAGHGVKHIFAHKGSKNSEFDSERASLEIERDISNEESISSSGRTSVSVSGELLNDQQIRRELAMNNEELTNKVNVNENDIKV